MGGYFAWTAVQTETFSYASVSDLQKAFSEIVPPVEAEPDGEVKKSSKFTVKAVYVDFVTSLTEHDVENYYDAALRSHGWKPMESRLTAQGGRYIRFCRGDMDAIIETGGTSLKANSTRYYFGVHRENGPAIKTGCGG